MTLNNIFFLFIGAMVTGAFDLIICYFVVNSLIGNKFKKTLKSITYQTGSLTFCFFIILSSARFISRAFDAMRPLSFIVVFIIILLFINIISKKHKMAHSPDEIILIFFSYFIFSQIIVALSMIPNMIFDSNFTTQFPSLISLITLTTAFLFILNRIDLSKFFIFITYRLAFKVAIFAIASTIALILIFILVAHNASAFSTLFAIGVLLIVMTIGLWHTLKIAHQYEVVIPEKYHDMRKILTLLNLRAEDAQTVHELKEMIEASIELMGVKVAEPSRVEANEPVDFEAFIKTNIESLKLNLQSNSEIRTNIQYFEPHKRVSAMNINYMLGILLENALETGTTYPIIVDILSTEHILFIKVANEAPKSIPQNLENLLAKGYSTKGKVGRGFGLSKLKKLVEKYDGSITISQEMNAHEQVKYILFTLNF